MSRWENKTKMFNNQQHLYEMEYIEPIKIELPRNI